MKGDIAVLNINGSIVLESKVSNEFTIDISTLNQMLILYE